MLKALLVAIIALLVMPLTMASTRGIGDSVKIPYTILDSSGNFVSGQTPTVSIQKSSNGYWYDFSSSTFKASGWTNKTANMTEDSTNKIYTYLFTPPATETLPEQYVFVVSNSNTTYRDTQAMTADYIETGSSSVSETAIADAVWNSDVSTGYSGKAGEYLKGVKDSTDGDKEGVSYTGIETLIRSNR